MDRARYSPGQNLARDTLYEIFIFAQESVLSDPKDWTRPPYNQIAFFPQNFGLVCAEWYATVLAFPRLWASLVLAGKANVPHYGLSAIRISLRRSAASPLRLYLHNYSLFTFETNTAMTRLEEILLPHLHRCVAITEYNPRASLLNHHESLRSLSHLNVILGHHNDRKLDTSLLQRLPSLTHLSINLRYISGTAKTACPRITTLHLHLDNSDILDVYSTLGGFEKLETLAMYGNFTWEHAKLQESHRPIDLPFLTSLYGYQVRRLPILMRLMHTPRLRIFFTLPMSPDCFIISDKDSRIPKAYTPLSLLLRIKEIPSFEHLVISITESSSEKVSDLMQTLFKYFPQIKQVTFGGTDGVVAAIEQLAKPPFEDRWPSLQIVGIEPSELTPDIPELIINLIHARYAGENSLEEVQSDRIETILNYFWWGQLADTGPDPWPATFPLPFKVVGFWRDVANPTFSGDSPPITKLCT